MSVNGEQVAGKTYSHVVQSIKNVPDVLFLTVLPQEEDVIQKVSSIYFPRGLFVGPSTPSSLSFSSSSCLFNVIWVRVHRFTSRLDWDVS